MTFTTWLDTFIEEKGIDTEHVFDITTDGFWGHHTIPVGVVLEAAKGASKGEQAQIKRTLVMIDFKNGDVLHFLEHLARGLAANAA